MIPIAMRCFMVAAVIGTIFVPPRAWAERDCSVPERFYTSQPPLKKTPQAVAAGRRVVIVVLGGASSMGRAAGSLELAWPARFGSRLAERFPSARAEVVNLAVARQTAKQAAERIERDVLPLKPTLVIWETGTMEAVRGLDVDDFRGTVQAGIDKLRATGAEVVLMNMQFSRAADAMIHFEPYLTALRELSDANDVPLFRRYGMMRHWAETDALDLRAEDGEKRQQVARKLYDCIGRAMADLVTHRQEPAKPADGAR
jgi:acyl-CoA thioesterase I